jgi:hypothetical protein
MDFRVSLKAGKFLVNWVAIVLSRGVLFNKFR